MPLSFWWKVILGSSNVTNSYFLFQAGLIPIVFLMTDPSNPEAASWLQDIGWAEESVDDFEAAGCEAVCAQRGVG
jgi:hypothetical protein